MSPIQRLEEAIRQGTKVHPNYGDYVENGVSIIWHRMNHQLGCTAIWSQEGALSSAHNALHEFNKRIRAERSG